MVRRGGRKACLHSPPQHNKPTRMQLEPAVEPSSKTRKPRLEIKGDEQTRKRKQPRAKARTLELLPPTRPTTTKMACLAQPRRERVHQLTMVTKTQVILVAEAETIGLRQRPKEAKRLQANPLLRRKMERSLTKAVVAGIDAVAEVLDLRMTSKVSRLAQTSQLP